MRDVMRREFADKTVVAVIHRLEAALEYDRILVLEGGEVVALGTPEEVMRTARLFRGVGGMGEME